MPEYISREAAKAFFTPKEGVTFLAPITVTVESLLATIDNIPAADVRPVVRCKDCRHRDPEDRKCDSGEMERQGCVFPVDDDYFCAYGER